MLTLFLLRHGKAANAEADQTDFERPLNKKGVVQINQVGYILNQSDKTVDQIISSSAERTKNTSQIVNHYLNLSAVTFDKELYLAKDSVILKKIALIKQQTILYVGHNFGISDLGTYLAAETCSMSTGMLIEFEFDIESWEMITQGCGRVKSVHTPNIYIP